MTHQKELLLLPLSDSTTSLEQPFFKPFKSIFRKTDRSHYVNLYDEFIHILSTQEPVSQNQSFIT